eukprot:scpid80492/ scgid5583/ Dual specificity protein phosphatase 2; Dual specificity protein phosphatase PAC-1
MALDVAAMAARALSSACFASQLQASSNLCVLDLRPNLQYRQSHIQDAISLSLSNLLLRRVAANGIGILPGYVKERLARASTIVLYDAETEDVERSADQKSALKVMLEAVQAVAMSVYFLCGGFSSFQSAYPDLCKVVAAENASSGSSTHGLAATQAHPHYHPSAPSAPAAGFAQSHPLQCRNASNLNLRLPSGRACAKSSAEELLSETKSPAQLAPHMFLGSIDHASDSELITSLGVTAVLNVSTQCKNYFSDRLKYMQIPVEDKINSSLMPYFQQAADFIGTFFRLFSVWASDCHVALSLLW